MIMSIIHALGDVIMGE